MGPRPPRPPDSPRRFQVGHPAVDAAIGALVQQAQVEFGTTADAELVREICVTAIKLLQEQAPRGDLKLVNSSLKEIRHALRVFAPWAHVRKVSVFGSARTPAGSPEYEQARRFGEAIAGAGWMVITGAGDGIMGAAQGGAGRERSFGVNIRLPWEQAANETIRDDKKLIRFRYFFTRKLFFMKEAHAIVLFPGGFGTHDEGFEALTLLQTGKSELVPVVFVDAPGGSYWADWNRYVETHLRARALVSPNDLSLYKVTDDVEAAVREVLRFYANYDSSRYVGDRLVIRVKRAPDPAQLEKLNAEFGDLLIDGRIETGTALPEENGEAADLPRLLLHFHRHDFGRLRQLVDRLNALVPDGDARDWGAAKAKAPHQVLPVEPPGRDADGDEG
jgi:uncharacterized protein (TIGR00730 family)